MKVHFCRPKVYRFKGWLFEYHSNLGTWPVKKNGDPRKKSGDAFNKIFDEFYQLPNETKEKYRIGGGCLSIDE